MLFESVEGCLSWVEDIDLSSAAAEESFALKAERIASASRSELAFGLRFRPPRVDVGGIMASSADL